jgi:hypothetical protein
MFGCLKYNDAVVFLSIYNQKSSIVKDDSESCFFRFFLKKVQNEWASLINVLCVSVFICKFYGKFLHIKIIQRRFSYNVQKGNRPDFSNFR